MEEKNICEINCPATKHLCRLYPDECPHSGVSPRNQYVRAKTEEEKAIDKKLGKMVTDMIFREWKERLGKKK